MTVQADFSLGRYSDGVLTVALKPSTPIGGWSLQFQMTKRFGGTALITKSVSSGRNGASGITVINSGQGVINVDLPPSEVSGFEAGNYAYTVRRTDSGFGSTVSEGYRLITF